MQAIQISKTRKIQRTVTKYLKQVLCLNATSKGTKQAQGWQTIVKGVIVSKPVKSVCINLSGRTVAVLTFNSRVVG